MQSSAVFDLCGGDQVSNDGLDAPHLGLDTVQSFGFGGIKRHAARLLPLRRPHRMWRQGRRRISPQTLRPERLFPDLCNTVAEGCDSETPRNTPLTCG